MSEELRTAFEIQRFVVLPGLLPGGVLRVAHEHAVKRAAAVSLQTDQQDRQVPGTPAVYGDAVMERLMVQIQPLIERVADRALYPTYAYFRVYKHGDVLRPHRDRGACEMTLSVNLGAVPDTPWLLWIEDPDGRVDVSDDRAGAVAGAVGGAGDGEGDGEAVKPARGIAVDLHPGDAVLFRGIERTHWRDAYDGEAAVQLFLHYVDRDGPYREWKFDKRAHLGCGA